jgi:hypothetical protein
VAPPTSEVLDALRLDLADRLDTYATLNEEPLRRQHNGFRGFTKAIDLLRDLNELPASDG